VRAFAFSFAVLVSLAPARSADEPVALDAPPAIRAELRALSDAPTRGERATAARALSERAVAEPYLRAFCETPAGKLEDYGSDALGVLQAARAKRNAERFEQWAKEGRYDLMVDASLDLVEVNDITSFGNLLLKFGNGARAVPKQFGSAEGSHYLFSEMKQFGRVNTHKDLASRGSIKTDHAGTAFVRAQSCEVTKGNRHSWLVVTRNDLKATEPLWENSYIFHNNDLVLHYFDWSLLVCDGDVTFNGSGLNCNASTIVAYGSVRSPGILGLSRGSVYAGGDIVAPKGVPPKSLLLAAGKIDVKEGPERVIKAGVKENPFFETADVGTETAFKDGTLSITKLTPGSPLTKFGVKPGDVVTQLNDKPIKTANDFRRELRNSVALEAGIFYITRDGAKITRVVYFHNGLEK
jgi:hypothetical protein